MSPPPDLDYFINLMSNDQLLLSVLSEKIYKLWPWLKSAPSGTFSQELDNYYSTIYTFEKEPWRKRLQDGIDEDETQRGIFAFLVCLEFGFDGSTSSRPGLWEFWKKLHEQVVCPCFASGKGDELMPQYISWPAKTFGLDEGLLRVIWHKVYDNVGSSVEEDWIDEHFHDWMMADMKHFETPKKKRKIPVPKKRSVPKPRARKHSNEDSE